MSNDVVAGTGLVNCKYYFSTKRGLATPDLQVSQNDYWFDYDLETEDCSLKYNH